LGVAALVIAAPFAYAAATKVKVVNTPKVKLAGGTSNVNVTNTPNVNATISGDVDTDSNISDTDGSITESESIADQGITQVPGTNGAIAVRTYAGGNGLLGAGDCTATTADGLPSVAVVPGSRIVTALIITGTDGRVTLTTDAVGNGLLPLSKFRVNAGHPNEVLALGNGLGTTAPLTFTGSSEATGAPGAPSDGSCNFVILGQPQSVGTP
jgi:hypothetical protein